MGGQVASNFRQAAVAPNLGARLNAACDAVMISHQQQAARIGIGRSTYFEVKAGRGGPATRERIPPQSADNAKTGLNRDFFGTVARPGAPPHRGASSRRTRCRRGAATRRVMRRWARTWRCEKLAAVFFPGSLERPGRLAGRLRFIRAGGYTFQIPQRFPGDLPHHRIRVPQQRDHELEPLDFPRIQSDHANIFHIPLVDGMGAAPVSTLGWWVPGGGREIVAVVGPAGWAGPDWRSMRHNGQDARSPNNPLHWVHTRLIRCHAAVGRLVDLLAELVLELIDGLCVSRTQGPSIGLLIGSDLLLDCTEL